MPSLPRALIALGLLVAPALAACGDKVEYHTVDFPGFSMSVPKSTRYEPSSTSEYRAGQAESKGLFRVVQVSWQVGSISTPEEMPNLVAAMESVMPEGSRQSFSPPKQGTVNSHKSIQTDGTVVVDGATISVSIIDVECGLRSVTIAVIAAKNIDSLRKHILDSYKCTPDPKEEAAIGGGNAMPFGLDDPNALATWARSPDEEMFIMEKGETIVVVAQTPRLDGEEKDALVKVFPEMFRSSGMTWSSTGEDARMAVTGPRTIYLGNITAEGVPMKGALTLFSCAERSDGVMGLAMNATGDLEEGIKALLAMRCAKDGDAPVNLLPPIADEEPAEEEAVAD